MLRPYLSSAFFVLVLMVLSSSSQANPEAVQSFTHQVESRNSSVKILKVSQNLSGSLTPRFLADQVREGDQIVFTESRESGQALGPFMLLRDEEIKILGQLDRDGKLIHAFKSLSGKKLESEILFHHGRAFASKTKDKEGGWITTRVDFQTETANFSSMGAKEVSADLNFRIDSESSVQAMVEKHTKEFAEKIEELRAINMRNQLEGRALATVESMFRRLSEAEMTRGMELQETEPQTVIELIASIGDLSPHTRVEKTSQFAFAGESSDVSNALLSPAQSTTPNSNRGPVRDVFR